MKKLLLITCFLSVTSLSEAATYYVAGTGQPTGNSTSWSTASSDLQWVINTKATFGDQVFVRAGLYAAPAAGFVLKNGVKVYGGFLGNETSVADRNWQTHISFLQGSGGRVVFNNNNNLGDGTILDGFTIENGSAPSIGGGGMYNKNVSPLILNCTFKNNTADGFGGGGVQNDGGTPSFLNCTFIDNRALRLSSGGAALCMGQNGGFIFEDCVFDNNNATRNGNGGALRLSSEGTNNIRLITGCRFLNNSSVAAAIFNSSTSLKIFRSYFYNNLAPRNWGGGIVENAAGMDITSCIFFDNKMAEGISNLGIITGTQGSQTKINGCTFANNESFSIGVNNGSGGLNTQAWTQIDAPPPNLLTKMIVTNSIFSNPLFDDWYLYVNYMYIANSLFPGAFSTLNNISNNAKFVDLNDPLGADGIIGTADDGLRLQQNSPAVNRGSLTAINSSEAWDYIDFMGNLRIQGPYMDMGAYESSYTTTAALPAIFGAISATRNGNSINVNWRTLSEKNVKHYEIQVSANGEQFTTVKTIGTKAENGNSEQPLDYTTSITINELATYMAIPFIGLLLTFALFPFAFKRRKSLILATSLVIVWTACSKQSRDMDTEKNPTIYLRLAQTDINEKVYYSKTVKVVSE